jgi:hypothetical protein
MRGELISLRTELEAIMVRGRPGRLPAQHANANGKRLFR